MLHGFSGHLISEAFLERLVADQAQAEARPDLSRRLTEWRQLSQELGPASSLRAMLNAGAEPLLAIFGFQSARDIVLREQTLAATLRDGVGAATLLVVSWGEPLDPHWRSAATDAIHRLTPWCFLFNGTHLRILDTERVFNRRYAQFDLEQALDDRRTISALRTLVRTYPLHRLVEASDRHASVVCRSLRTGVLSASTAVLSALTGGDRRAPSKLDAAFEQALTIVYRVLFLLFAEARALVPMWHPVYRESYSLDALRDAVEQPGGTPGLWDALRAITRLAHTGCTAGDLRVTPFNGRLFAPARTPLVDRRNLDDEAARTAMLALSTRPSADCAGRERIVYRDLGVEQMGAVYETLLDYGPVLDTTKVPGMARLERRAGPGVRKSTGTFYTPQPIAEYLVRRTLGPLVNDADPERILQLRVVDPAMGSGAFLVAACRYLASAYEAALVRTGRCHPSDIDEPQRVSIRRSVAERCLYGVDLNPMAVQLARLSVWLTTLAADRPLSFLDHRLLLGNSLVGAWLSLLTRAPEKRLRRAGAPRGPMLFDEQPARDLLREVLPVRFALESVPNDTVEQVREKERALTAMNARESTLRAWRRIADLWCASWLDGGSVPAEAYSALTDHVLARGGALPGHIADRYLRLADEVSTTHLPFHWELECPEVFFSADGTRLPNAGFDAVIGNPPWDMLRADPRASNVQAARMVRFTRDAGMYTAQSDGHANSYQLFVERAISLTRAGGRVGLVVPSGLATDRGSAPLRRLLLAHCDVDALVGFENNRGVFPIHRSIRFLLMTASAGRPSQSIACRFGVNDPVALETVGEEPAARSPWFHIRLRPSALGQLSGDELTIPWLRMPVDLALAERSAALFPPLGSDIGWAARFGRELNATEDRRLFNTSGNGLPVVGGKQIQPFAVELAACQWAIRPRDALARLRDARHTRPRMAYRDVASATNQLTLIAAVLPAHCVSTHTVFCLRTRLPLADQHLLCALFNSFVVNYLVRLRVSTHVTTATVERLPVPTRAHAPGAARELAALGRILARRRDPAANARLQAGVARLYQLTADEFAYVLSTFPLVPEETRDAALKIFVADARSPGR